MNDTKFIIDLTGIEQVMAEMSIDEALSISCDYINCIQLLLLPSSISSTRKATNCYNFEIKPLIKYRILCSLISYKFSLMQCVFAGRFRSLHFNSISLLASRG